VSEILADIFQYLTAEKFMHYMEAQFPIYCEKRPANVYRDPTMETLVITYVDYLHMCRRQAYDMKDKSVLFPKNCAAAHDREAEPTQALREKLRFPMRNCKSSARSEPTTLLPREGRCTTALAAILTAWQREDA